MRGAKNLASSWTAGVKKTETMIFVSLIFDAICGPLGIEVNMDVYFKLEYNMPFNYFRDHLTDLQLGCWIAMS